jgi:hypothetical protein
MARDGKSEQAYDLADTLENIPGFLVNWEPQYFEQIKYRQVSVQDYAKYLAEQPPPEEF